MSYSIIITASYIPSHPSIKHIRETIESLNCINMSTDTPIILAHDYSDNPNYIEYLKNLNEYIKNRPNIIIVKRATHGHLTGNIRNAINYINTKYVLVIQHDFPFINKFNIEDIIIDMEKYNQLKHIRFNKRQNIKIRCDGINDLFGLEIKCINYTYTRTPWWSDNNHLCLTDYYKNIVLTECRDGGAMENTLGSRSINEATHAKYGTYLFGPLNNKQMIRHTDGRCTI